MSSHRISTRSSSSSPSDPPSIASSLNEDHQNQPLKPATPTAPVVLVGTVFARQQLFATLPEDVQEDAKQFRTYVEKDKQWLFRTHHHALVKSVYSVKSKNLLDVISHWLQTRIVPGQEATEQPQGARGRAATMPASTKKNKHRGSPEQLKKAKHIAEALVLLGFLTPYKDDKPYQNFITTDYYVQGSDLLIPVAPNVTELKTTSVWSVADGALYAHALKRKAGVLGSFSQGKDVYVVFNDKTKKVYLFESDLAREPIMELKGATMMVEFENANFEFGVHVAYNKYFKPEVFNAETESAQLAFVFACLGIGAKYADGNVKKLIMAEKAGLIACDGASGEQFEDDSDEMTGFEEPAPVSELETEAVASGAARTLSVRFDDQPVDEHENQQDGSESRSVELLGHHDSWYSASEEDLNQPEDSYRISAEHQLVQEDKRVDSPPASLEEQGIRFDRRSASMGAQSQPGAGTDSTKQQGGYHPVGLFTSASAASY